MDKLPSAIIQFIYEYDPTYKVEIGKVLKQLTAHCFIYRCCICCKHYNNCCCYCSVCKTYKTYLKLCQQIYYDERSTYEDELEQIIASSG